MSSAEPQIHTHTPGVLDLRDLEQRHAFKVEVLELLGAKKERGEERTIFVAFEDRPPK